jgi:two-component system OmpR family response regulator
MSKSILIVEDDALLGETLHTMLTLLEHNPTVCNTLSDAKNAITDQSWDVILSDYSLGVGTGVDVMNHAIETNSEAVLIISSGYEREQFEEQLKGLDQVLWLNKPYKIDELVKLLK